MGGAVVVIVTISVARVVLSSLLSARLGHTDVVLQWWWHDPGHVNVVVVVACTTVVAWAPCHTLMTSCSGGGMTQGTSSSSFSGMGCAHCAVAVVILQWW